MPVLTAGGAVGIVKNVSFSTSIILLLYDSKCKIGGIIMETRTQGIIEGTGSPYYYEMLIEDQNAQVKQGDCVITSGFEGGIFPKGYTVGTVKSLITREDGAKIVRLIPPFSYGKLEKVIVITEKAHEITQDNEP